MGIIEDTKIIRAIKKYSKKISKKPEKLLFGNTNILTTFANEFGIEVNKGTLRETFFASCFDGAKDIEKLYYSDIGDFQASKYIFEIGGESKDFKQIRDIQNSYLVIDTDYVAVPNKIPLWLFGCMH